MGGGGVGYWMIMLIIIIERDHSFVLYTFYGMERELNTHNIIIIWYGCCIGRQASVVALSIYMNVK